MISFRPQVVPFVFVYIPAHGLISSLLIIVLGCVFFLVIFVRDLIGGRLLRNLSLKWGACKWISFDVWSLDNIELLILIITNIRKRKTKIVYVQMLVGLECSYHKIDSGTSSYHTSHAFIIWINK